MKNSFFMGSRSLNSVLCPTPRDKNWLIPTCDGNKI